MWKRRWRQSAWQGNTWWCRYRPRRTITRSISICSQKNTDGPVRECRLYQASFRRRERTFDSDRDNSCSGAIGKRKMNEIRKYPRTPHLEGSRLQPGDEDLSQIRFSEIQGKHLVVEENATGRIPAFLLMKAGGSCSRVGAIISPAATGSGIMI